MGQVRFGMALIGAALVAQFAVPAGLAAPVQVPVSNAPQSLLDAQETPPETDEESLDQPAPAPVEEPVQDEGGESQSGETDTTAPVDDTELLDQGSRPVEPAPVPVEPAPEPAPPVAAEPAPAPVAEAPVAAEPVPAEAAPVDSSADEPVKTESPALSWPFTTGGSVFVNAGFGPGEVKAGEGFDTCEYRVSNGRAYVGIHCTSGNQVVGFTPPAWKVAQEASSTFPTTVSDDFWSRMTGEGGAVRVPVPGPVAAPEGTRIVEGRSRERTKTTTISRNGESETVTKSGKDNQSDTPKDSSSSDNGRTTNDRKKSSEATAQASGNSSNRNGNGSESARQLSGDDDERKDKDRKHKRGKKKNQSAEQSVADVRISESEFASCVQESARNPEQDLDCGAIIRDEIDASMERNTAK